MSDTTWMNNLEVRCRCGQIGVINGVEGSSAFPDNVWVTHRVGLTMQTHIHRKPQMTAIMAQVARQSAKDGDEQ
ncbi:hypothetical protein [uncultured Jatrophihabitans sp.]|uniref:hypothetical protein n=1 Tax=uncultured Jatrophihabitans sp. TaxID=1610747 RepID=UPI0035C9CAEF